MPFGRVKWGRHCCSHLLWTSINHNCHWFQYLSQTQSALSSFSHFYNLLYLQWQIFIVFLGFWVWLWVCDTWLAIQGGDVYGVEWMWLLGGPEIWQAEDGESSEIMWRLAGIIHWLCPLILGPMMPGLRGKWMGVSVGAQRRLSRP